MLTLIIGIVCSNGIVVGADGAATLSVLGQNTARQNARKLSIIKCGGGHDAILGVSGPVGFSQRIAGIVSKHTLGSSTRATAMETLRKALWEQLLGQEFQVATIAKNVYPQMAQQCLSSTMYALPVGANLELLQFSETAACEAATDDLPFVSIGSGQPTADPFLAFIRRIFWGKNKPTVSEGIFSVWWALHHAITVSPGGIADPKQLMVLELKDKKSVGAANCKMAS